MWIIPKTLESPDPSQGNGVVPATAELAWRVLYARLKKEF